ncbi:MAG: AtpZ/AtpI family protein [Sulfurospirillaceae bacterium]|jgi:F0F1-type ATP synthase assembly protein I|nr:AtpZ/AtpI family protein [Sulfurospirillaceae bacterium]MCK9545821.1 AtpZ/AtpI family protein [Sulfurospirillaceae bacterium]MDY0238377.1 AtpZ/AtpI family protein [Campylobacterales bacterium]
MSKKPKIRSFIEGAEQLTLGISMVVAVALGVGLGLLMRNLTGIGALFWLGVAWGIGAAILNVYKAYKKHVKSFDEYKEENRYKKEI